MLWIYLKSYYKLHNRYYLPESQLYLWLKSKGIPFFKDKYLIGYIALTLLFSLVFLGITYESATFQINGESYANLYRLLSFFLLIYTGSGIFEKNYYPSILLSYLATKPLSNGRLFILRTAFFLLDYRLLSFLIYVTVTIVMHFTYFDSSTTDFLIIYLITVALLYFNFSIIRAIFWSQSSIKVTQRSLQFIINILVVLVLFISYSLKESSISALFFQKIIASLLILPFILYGFEVLVKKRDNKWF